jgi:hypothetical protein
MSTRLRIFFAGPIWASFHAISEATNLQDSFVNFDKHGAERKLWLDRYKTAKSQCSWVSDMETLEYVYDWFPTDGIMKGSYWAYLTSQISVSTYYPDLPRWVVTLLRFLFSPPAHGATLQSFRCSIGGAEGSEFRIRRLGPFVGNGGFDWHKMKMEDPFKLRSQVQHGAVHVTGFMSAPVAESGEILGNPPIHIHHANLGPNPNRSSLSRLSQWHGDSQCSHADGGTACYVTVLPQGFGFPVSQELRLDTDFNDVRPSGSPDLHFWLEAAISIAKPAAEKPVNEVGTVILGVPFSFRFWTASDFQRLYFVPSDQPSALWMTARMPTSGTFVAGKLETHQHMLDEAWVFSATSLDDLGLGLSSESWQLQKAWQPWVPKENGWSNETAAIQSLKSDALSHFEKAVQRCGQHLSCRTPPTLVWTLNSTVIENGEEREMSWPNTTWTFEEGDLVSIVIFHKAMAMPMHGASPAPGSKLAQHLAVTGHYIPKAGKSANYFYVLPSTHVERAWTNSVHWLPTLIYQGGPPANLWCWQSAAALFLLSVLTCMATLCILMVYKRIAAKAFIICLGMLTKQISAKPRYLQVSIDEETGCRVAEDTEIQTRCAEKSEIDAGCSELKETGVETRSDSPEENEIADDQLDFNYQASSVVSA